MEENPQRNVSRNSNPVSRGGAPIGAGGHDPHFSRQRGTGDKVNVENTNMSTENISISVSQLQIKQRN